ncbi:hypothetical protein [Paraburkholderia sediminicola]|uniref:hypothetical protein n=1 Tax=Paraburkholderia sediminicola TaxID=458836 RepID=UPI0038BA8618
MRKTTQQKMKESHEEYLRIAPEKRLDAALEQPLYDLVEEIKGNLDWLKVLKERPTPVNVEVLGAMERALIELDALQQKYFPDEEEAAA